jgi:hypothetical protein
MKMEQDSSTTLPVFLFDVLVVYQSDCRFNDSSLMFKIKELEDIAHIPFTYVELKTTAQYSGLV